MELTPDYNVERKTVDIEEFGVGDSWRSDIAGSETSLGFLKIRLDSILTQKVLHPTWGNSILYLIKLDKDKLIAGLKVIGCLGIGNHGLITFDMGKESPLDAHLSLAISPVRKLGIIFTSDLRTLGPCIQAISKSCRCFLYNFLKLQLFLIITELKHLSRYLPPCPFMHERSFSMGLRNAVLPHSCPSGILGQESFFLPITLTMSHHTLNPSVISLLMLKEQILWTTAVFLFSMCTLSSTTGSWYLWLLGSNVKQILTDTNMHICMCRHACVCVCVNVHTYCGGYVCIYLIF